MLSQDGWLDTAAQLQPRAKAVSVCADDASCASADRVSVFAAGQNTPPVGQLAAGWTTPAPGSAEPGTAPCARAEPGTSKATDANSAGESAQRRRTAARDGSAARGRDRLGILWTKTSRRMVASPLSFSGRPLGAGPLSDRSPPRRGCSDAREHRIPIF